MVTPQAIHTQNGPCLRMMEPRPLPSDLSPAEWQARGRYYRELAKAAATPLVRDTLIRLAERFERMAVKKAADPTLR